MASASFALKYPQGALWEPGSEQRPERGVLGSVRLQALKGVRLRGTVPRPQAGCSQLQGAVGGGGGGKAARVFVPEPQGCLPQTWSCSRARPSAGGRQVGSWTCTSSWALSPRAWCSSTWKSWVGLIHGPAPPIPPAPPRPLRSLPPTPLPAHGASLVPPDCRLPIHAALLGPGLPPLPLGLLLHRRHPPGGREHDPGPLPPGECWEGVLGGGAGPGRRLPGRL